MVIVSSRTMELDGVIVRWTSKGYGFVETAEGDVFCLASTLPAGVEPSVGTRVRVRAIEAPRGLRAVFTELV